MEIVSIVARNSAPLAAHQKFPDKFPVIFAVNWVTGISTRTVPAGLHCRRDTHNLLAPQAPCSTWLRSGWNKQVCGLSCPPRFDLRVGRVAVNSSTLRMHLSCMQSDADPRSTEQWKWCGRRLPFASDALSAASQQRRTQRGLPNYC